MLRPKRITLGRGNSGILFLNAGGGAKLELIFSNQENETSLKVLRTIPCVYRSQLQPGTPYLTCGS